MPTSLPSYLPICQSTVPIICLPTQTIVLLKNDAAGEEGGNGGSGGNGGYRGYRGNRGKHGSRSNGGTGGTGSRRGNWGARGTGAALYAPSRPTPHAPAQSPEPGWDEPGWDWGGAAAGAAMQAKVAAALETDAENKPKSEPTRATKSATPSPHPETAAKGRPNKGRAEGDATKPAPALPLLPLDPKAYSAARPLRLLLVGKEAAAPTVLGGGSGSVVPASVSSPLAALRSRLGLPPLPSPPSKCAQKLQHSPQLRTRRAPPPSHKPHRGRGGREAANGTVGPGGRRALRRRFQAEQDERSLSAAAPNLHACCEQCAARNPSPGSGQQPTLPRS